MSAETYKNVRRTNERSSDDENAFIKLIQKMFSPSSRMGGDACALGRVNTSPFLNES